MQPAFGDAQGGDGVRIEDGLAVQDRRLTFEPKLDDIPGIQGSPRRRIDKHVRAFTVGNEVVSHQWHADVRTCNRFGLAVYLGRVERQNGVVRWRWGGHEGGSWKGDRQELLKR
ncbi:hypothetical protein PS718_00001 [Pseudomonas fluorescens]|uniref:Uncharacterized protein n=1 Tax=Pseudomonas fluorescens TaxID=294 RepID=A0A5E6ZJW8_PSEFL|nr:hypothetical protein PS718_00001 [Pseudomonas fluorescens]